VAAGKQVFAGFELQLRTHAALPEDVAKIAEQPVTDICSGRSHAAQGHAQRDARRGQLHAVAAKRENGLRQAELTPEGLEGQAGIAERATHIDVVTRSSAAAQQRLAMRHIAQDGDGNIERSLRGVAANEFAVVRVGQGKQALREPLQPGLVGARQGQ